MKMRVWWIPQVGASASFYILVNNIEEARKYMDILAAYDAFQYNQNIKPDYCNAGGVQVWCEEDQDWEEWHGYTLDDYFEDVDEYIETLDNTSEFEEFTSELLKQVKFD